MATYRKVHTSFWQDPYVLGLTPECKYFYLYLMTNSRTNMAGAYEIPVQVACIETGYNRETVQKLLSFFSDDGKILYDSESGEVLLVNWMKHNFSDSPKIVECIKKDCEKIKSEILYRYCMDTLDKHIHTKTKTKTKNNIGEYLEFLSESFSTNEAFVSAWTSWVHDRADRKNPITERAAKMQIKFLSAYKVDVATKIVETSVARGWVGLFPPKDIQDSAGGYMPL